MRRFPIWSWFWFVLGMLYFFIPLLSTFEFSLRMIKGKYTFEAYRVAFEDPRFYQSFGYSLLWAVVTIVISLLLVVPTAYWVQLKLPKLRPVVEFITLMPFVVPAVVLRGPDDDMVIRPATLLYLGLGFGTFQPL